MPRSVSRGERPGNLSQKRKGKPTLKAQPNLRTSKTFTPTKPMIIALTQTTTYRKRSTNNPQQPRRPQPCQTKQHQNPKQPHRHHQAL